MSAEKPHSIRISVETEYLSEQSDPELNRYVFAYTMTIENLGNVGVQLISRHWLITDSNGKTEEVRGEGVVGEQPVLSPGQGFQYTSGTVIDTPIGTMQGSYQMVTEDSNEFDVLIQPFRLADENLIN